MYAAVHEAYGPVRRACALCALAWSAGTGCSAPSVEKPPAPDMTGLVEAYRRPTADFDAERLPELVATLAVVEAVLDRTNLREALVNVLREVLDVAVDASTQVEDELELELVADGYMRITRICSGWVSPPAPDRVQNGALLVTSTFSERGLDPTLWGETDRCRYLAGDVQVELLQDIASSDAVKVYWGEALEAEALEDRSLIVDLSLVASLDGESLPLDFDFRSLADGNIEYRVEQGDGALIASAGGGDRILVRARNGTFDCEELDCSQIAGSEGP